MNFSYVTLSERAPNFSLSNDALHSLLVRGTLLPRIFKRSPSIQGVAPISITPMSFASLTKGAGQGKSVSRSIAQ